MKDFDITLQYHPGKANVVADALSRYPVAMFLTMDRHLLEDLESLGIEVVIPGIEGQFMSMQIQSGLIERIKEAQFLDESLRCIREQVRAGLVDEFTIADDGSLRHGSQLCVPRGSLREEIMQEAHQSQYSMH
ncbi:hypothetical protein ACDT16_13775, partial [Staphylococcus aureus]